MFTMDMFILDSVFSYEKIVNIQLNNSCVQIYSDTLNDEENQIRLIIYIRYYYLYVRFAFIVIFVYRIKYLLHRS